MNLMLKLILADVDPRLIDGSAEESNEVLEIPKLQEKTSGGGSSVPTAVLPTNAPKSKLIESDTDSDENTSVTKTTELKSEDDDLTSKKSGFLRNIFKKNKE